MFLRFTWFPVSWSLLLVFLHAIPGEELPKPHWDILEFDTLVHFTMFAVLSFSWSVGLNKQNRFYRLRLRYIPIILLFSLMFGAMLEFMQDAIFVGRYFQLSDLLADYAGAVTGMVLFLTIYRSTLKLVR